MELGKHLNELLRQRVAAAICFALAAFAALTVSYDVDLLPPKITPRSVEIASATTQMLVDGRVSTVLDLRQGAGDIEGMTNYSVLIGNLMVSEPVLRFVGRRAGVPPSAIRGQAPLTADFPRPFTGVGQDPETKDLLRSTDQYRLNIQTNPAVPMIEIFAQAPTAKAAATLANASVTGLRDYLAEVAKARGTAPKDQVTLTQLGHADGAVINGGARPQVIALTFFIVFALSAATAVFLGRVRRGWTQAVEDEHEDGPGDGPRDGPGRPPGRPLPSTGDGDGYGRDASYVLR
jgi:hypothetical protein